MDNSIVLEADPSRIAALLLGHDRVYCWPMAAKPPKSPLPPIPLGKINPRDPAALASMLAQLPPDQADAFIERLERIYLRRKVQTWGYLMATLIFAMGVLVALFYWALVQTWESVMLLVVPVILAALVLIGFGKWARRI